MAAHTHRSSDSTAAIKARAVIVNEKTETGGKPGQECKMKNKIKKHKAKHFFSFSANGYVLQRHRSCAAHEPFRRRREG